MMVLLTVVTFGIYNLYWYCSVQNQLRGKTGEGFWGLGHFLLTLVTLGIYGFYWYFVVTTRIEKAGGQNKGITYGLIYLVGSMLGGVLMMLGMDVGTDGSLELGAMYWVGILVMLGASIGVMLMIQKDINEIPETAPQQ